VPIFEPVIQAVWAHHSPKVALAPPSPEAKRQMTCVVQADPEEQQYQYQNQGRRPRGVSECFRIDRSGRIVDTQYQLVSREQSYGDRGYHSTFPNPFGWFQSLQPQYYNDPRPREYYHDNYGRVVPRESVRPQQQAPSYGQYRRDPRAQQPQQQRDQNPFWGFRRF